MAKFLSHRRLVEAQGLRRCCVKNRHHNAKNFWQCANHRIINHRSNRPSGHRMTAATKRGPPRRVEHAPSYAGVPERGRPVRRAMPLAESTRFYTLYTAYFPEAVAEGSDQSEFNPHVHGRRVGGRAVRAPAPRVALSRDHRGQDARAPRGGPGFVRAVAGKMPASPGGKSNAAFPWQCAVIGSSTIGTTGQLNIRPSDGGCGKARPVSRTPLGVSKSVCLTSSCS